MFQSPLFLVKVPLLSYIGALGTLSSPLFMSCSSLKRPSSVDDGNDVETQILIAELFLADLTVGAPSNAQASSSSSPPKLAAEPDSLGVLSTLLQQLKQQQHSGTGSSQAHEQELTDILKTLGLLAEAELDDHRTALALSRGERIPAFTEAQKTMSSSLSYNSL